MVVPPLPRAAVAGREVVVLEETVGGFSMNVVSVVLYGPWVNILFSSGPKGRFSHEGSLCIVFLGRLCSLYSAHQPSMLVERHQKREEYLVVFAFV